MANLTWATEKTHVFNVNEFDENVAKTIVSIHYSEEKKKFNKWINKNKEHLEAMYLLSGLDCGFDIFSDYIYLNTI